MIVALFVIGAENLGRSCERPGFSALNHYYWIFYFYRIDYVMSYLGMVIIERK